MLGTLRRDPVWLVLAVLAIAMLGIFLIWPLATMLSKSLIGPDGSVNLNGYVRFFSDRSYREAFTNTLILGVAVTVSSMLVGGSLAIIVARCKFPLVGLVSALPLVTLVIPDVVVAAAWVLVLGKQGIVNTLIAPLGVTLPSIYSWWGLIFVMTLNNYVYAFVAVYVGLKSMDRNLEEAAQSLGRPMSRVIGGVTMPMLMPSIFAGAMIVFTHVIGSFGVPAILGARTPVLAVKAYHEFVSEMGGNAQMQTTMASLLVVLGAVVLLVQKFVVERRQFQMESGRSPGASSITGWRAVVAAFSVILVVALSMLPAAVVSITAFTPTSGPVLRYGSFTLDNIAHVLIRAPQALYHSLLLATVATIAGTLFAIIAAYLIVKRRAALTHTLDVLVTLPLTIAGTVLGIALINNFGSGWLVLTGSWVIMALAYFLRRVPTSVRAAIGPLHNLRDSIEEASMSLGVSPIQSFFKVVLPVIGPSVAAAAVLMWVTTLSELSATIVLYFGGMSTVPIEIFQQVDSDRLALACAYSLVLLLTIFIPLAIARWIFRLKIGTVE
ncbi:ABC transporter permease [Pseudomonas gingeri]|uniref:Iron ABC transporter permease n=1 Tax=Pseudomonas gingeri TaxID=117681 RepID=A0A7Y7YGB3_9PSED|nr:iron ABC transporter permease [Pseudomonas gingeri]NWB31440.1 iron ABC transporter permease [Pseudomonas gingeri]NWC35695.1 iron ABC transporter permease [Pseudomonas gingeri]NWD49454.1 iron ABC transporter permease [Pseudomonas gingeri]